MKGKKKNYFNTITSNARQLLYDVTQVSQFWKLITVKENSKGSVYRNVRLSTTEQFLMNNQINSQQNSLLITWLNIHITFTNFKGCQLAADSFHRFLIRILRNTSTEWRYYLKMLTIPGVCECNKKVKRTSLWGNKSLMIKFYVSACKIFTLVKDKLYHKSESPFISK